MRERVQILGGSLEVDSQPDRGTRIRVSVPLAGAAGGGRARGMNAMSKIRILLADDHTLFRAGIRALLQTLGDIEVVAEANDGREALRLVEVHRPDVVLLDILMPGLNGLDAAARIGRTSSRSRVIVLSMNADADSVLRALRAGAVGYLVKTADPAELEMAIRAVTRGEKFLSSAITEHVVAALSRTARTGANLAGTAHAAAARSAAIGRGGSHDQGDRQESSTSASKRQRPTEAS